MKVNASSIRPPSQPWSVPFTSQSTSSCSDSEIRLPVESLVIPSMAATAENAQQHPIQESKEDHSSVDTWRLCSNSYLQTKESPWNPHTSYTIVDSKCKAKEYAITGFEKVPENDEAALCKAVASQPISVSINVGDFTNSTRGVFTRLCGIMLDHDVTA
nr:senescence-specific cysteine protease SAG39-like [Ipomoea batatas]